ncbi:uncharacterized protein KY384_005244 [Bacidia gigantensis]|uniref:uncharacterized protein n=1 Tax=Bacidia gigantensis TaxID=2732470 RepID=UPI001D054509|nr:uncharacterized protein KY384_005244 [Bacidia gigantensis]KAG8529763.1 hypothetical protein KY384_005244 [Bacidia gigantensis]
MAPSILKKRKRDDQSATKAPKKFRKQKHYTSSSSSSASENDDHSFPAVDLADSDGADDPETDASEPSTAQEVSKFTDSAEQFSDSSYASDFSISKTPSNTHSSSLPKTKSKRNDPAAFANSISTILSSKLTTQKRSDPVLSRSVTAKEASKSLSNSKLEEKAKRKLKEEKREAFDKGRVKNVLLGTGGGAGVVMDADGKGEGGMSIGELQEQEKRLRKTAQRGVVKLFNAVRAAQVKAEEARAQGGLRNRTEERVGEMSRKGFLNMVAAGGAGSSGGKKMEGKEIEEA